MENADVESGAAAIVEGDDGASGDFGSGDDYADDADEADWVVLVEEDGLTWDGGLVQSVDLF